MPFNFHKFINKKSTPKPPSPTSSTNIIEKLREAFDKFDTNNSGVLDLEEIQAALQEPCCSHHHHPDCPVRTKEIALRKLIAEFDADSDGKLTLAELRLLGHDLGIPFAEFLKWTRTPTGEELKALPLETVIECLRIFVSRQMKSKEAQDLFKLADVDQSGKLSLAEIKRLLAASDFDVDDKELQKIFKRVDANGDGELDDEEFLNLVKYIIGNK
ncbi:hypothetical protein Aperf_G00000018873 [Anoplocephala perfoliata]